MHKGLATKNPEETIAEFLGLPDHPIKRVHLHRLLRSGDVNPATLAPQVATIDDGNIKKGWKIFSLFESSFEPLHRTDPLESHVPDKFPQQALVGLKEYTFGHP